LSFAGYGGMCHRRYRLSRDGSPYHCHYSLPMPRMQGNQWPSTTHHPPSTVFALPCISLASWRLGVLGAQSSTSNHK
jgi:hypothetical protein